MHYFKYFYKGWLVSNNWAYSSKKYKNIMKYILKSNPEKSKASFFVLNLDSTVSTPNCKVQIQKCKTKAKIVNIAIKSWFIIWMNINLGLHHHQRKPHLDSKQQSHKTAFSHPSLPTNILKNVMFVQTCSCFIIYFYSLTSS